MRARWQHEMYEEFTVKHMTKNDPNHCQYPPHSRSSAREIQINSRLSLSTVLSVLTCGVDDIIHLVFSCSTL